MIAFELFRTQFYQPLFALYGAGMKDSVIVEAASLWLVSAMDVSVKAMLLALLAGVALKLTRIADPNLRHRVWTGILMAMLAMPVLSQLLPSLRLPFAIDSSWLITQQDPSIVEVQAPQTVNAIQAESLAFESGAIASGSVFQNYRVGFGYDQLTGPKEGNSDRIDTYRNPVNPSPKWPTSMREVDIDADATNYSLDLQLDPGASVRLAIQDLDGKPVAGISAQGLAPNGNGSATHDKAPRAANFGAKETRSIVLRHDKRRIGSVLRIGPEEVKQEQIAVVLEPFATVRGKLMLDAEHAATGAVIQARVLPSEDFSLSLPEVATDNEGRFQMDLITGCKYYLDVRGNQIGNSSLAKELTIVPGRHIDMGTLVFVEGSFVGPLLRP